LQSAFGCRATFGLAADVAVAVVVELEAAEAVVGQGGLSPGERRR
jgi:hypothetical protein